MGDRPEAIEGQAKLFRVLIAFARYNPQIGYVQGKKTACTSTNEVAGITEILVNFVPLPLLVLSNIFEYRIY